MKLCKLFVHTKSFSGEDLVINPKDFPNLQEGDIIEIYHPEVEFSRLLLQITEFKDLQGKDAVSVEQSIAATFQLRAYADVYVNIVTPESVTLDSVELVFKDQYMGRSEMWRLKNSLVNTCVYLNKKIEFCGGSVRCQVYEMWSMGDRVACGVINKSTKIVFRSSTSMVYLFLQMSSEMWDFDIHGDLYFEKAVNGFLADLFQKWKKQGSNHEVTIVLFSRTFYKAHSLDEFPHHMRECLQQDYKGRFYEDFYRVAVQNERYDEWSNILVELRRLFSDYCQSVLEYNNRPDTVIPTAINSTAAQGNFLEVLNMSLNVFEKHYLDRSFDRTGQLSVVITPGVGVFEVDRELTNVTKQRVIDNGVGSDLVCLGEQPLHAVPLLKFHNKDSLITADDYSMPHWINLSFYSSNKRVANSNFLPRIKLPPKRLNLTSRSISMDDSVRTKILHEEEDPLALVDYDAYDAQVFTVPTVQLNKNHRVLKKTSFCGVEATIDSKNIRRKMSDPDLHHNFNFGLRDKSQAVPIQPLNSPMLDQLSPTTFINNNIQGKEENESPPWLIPYNIYQPRSGRALINPFDPSHITIRLTSNRRRWSHIFPKGPSGQLIQQHHYQAKIISPKVNNKNETSTQDKSPAPSINWQVETKNKRPSIPILSGLLTPHSVNRKSVTLLWGVTGEQEWTPALTTGVDWKSLTIPACLPITTDYFPDDVCLCRDYVFSDYNLLPDDNSEYVQQRAIYRKPLQTREVFQELISQRLSQGFQLIVEEPNSQTPGTTQSSSIIVAGSKLPELQQQTEEYKLSIGRIFHRIALTGSEIRVTRYRPRHPYPPFNFHYWYRFQAPDHPTYGVSWISFTTEKLENFNWNHLDNYICTRGDTDFPLMEGIKYWRFRLYLLPYSQSGTKKILEGSEHCDVYTLSNADEQRTLSDNFVKYIETWVNKIRRQYNHVNKQRLDLSGLNVPNHMNRRRHSTGIIYLKSSMVGNSPFRERLGSNRLPEKPRPRSGSKVMERGRASPAIDSFGTSSADNDSLEGDQELSPFSLKEGCSHEEIAEHMKSSSHGVGLLSQLPGLPKQTFVSSDAVQWMLSHVDGINTQQQAIDLLQEMINEKLICHASGNFSQKFILGFYLYHIVKGSKDESKYDSETFGDLQAFENEWVEVKVKEDFDQDPIPIFLRGRLPHPCPHVDQKGPLYKECHLEVDVQNKSDRVEWGHVKYQASYKPTMAYEMIVKWVASSGSIITDLILGWARKAQPSGLQMIPIPADPFALPYSIKSDPLRGPLFIPLDIEALMGTKSYLFEEFPEESRAQRLVLFQETIALLFGFIPCSIDSSQHQHNQYIHLSGNSFLMIPSPRCEYEKCDAISISRPVRTLDNDIATSITPHHEYITRHVGDRTATQETRVGFLWSWNHMVSRRWKLGGPMNATSDETFQNKLLNDFKNFCSNGNNRLKIYWDLAWDKLRETKSLS